MLLLNRLKQPFEPNNLNLYMASLSACDECVCLEKNDIAIEHMQDLDKLLTSMGLSDDHVQATLDAQPMSWGDFMYPIAKDIKRIIQHRGDKQ